MKTLLKSLVLALFVGLLFSTTSCVVTRPHDSGKHKGWYKQSHRSHHPKKIKIEYADHKQDKKQKKN